MSETIFEFGSYLSKVDPAIKYNVTRLSGGVVNVVVRATKDVSDLNEGAFPQTKSIILKYAPPYIAGVGPTAKFDQYRQEIEARAMRLASDVAHGTDDVHVAKLLRHDRDNHVLILEDLGDLPNLTDIFSAVGGYTPLSPPIRNIDKLPRSITTVEIVKNFQYCGEKLGTFFGVLHSPTTRDGISNDPGKGAGYLSNPSTTDTVFEHGIKPIRDHLLLFPDIVAADEAAALFQRIADNFHSGVTDFDRCFTLGDCWPGSILLDSPLTTVAQPRLAVVDWEFASIGSGLSGDIAQFLAHLELYYVAAQHRGLDEYVDFINGFVESFVAAYSATSTVKGAGWTVRDQAGDNTISSGAGRDCTVRAALISHAAEMINCAFWKVWICQDSSCSHEESGNSSNASLSQCKLIKKMVETAVWYLRMAGDDMKAFRQPSNKKMILDQYAKKDSAGILGFL